MITFTDDNIKTMERFNHALQAEESISNYIRLLEKDSGLPMPEEDKEWLYKKGKYIFDLYYINEKLDITVATLEDNKILSEYIAALQGNMSKMFAHILVSEFKLYLLEKKYRGE
jgi:hypothetical protein